MTLREKIEKLIEKILSAAESLADIRATPTSVLMPDSLRELTLLQRRLTMVFLLEIVEIIAAGATSDGTRITVDPSRAAQALEAKVAHQSAKHSPAGADVYADNLSKMMAHFSTPAGSVLLTQLVLSKLETPSFDGPAFLNNLTHALRIPRSSG